MKTSKLTFILLLSILSLPFYAQKVNKPLKNTSLPQYTILYFAPQIEPLVEEIVPVTTETFFSSLTNSASKQKKLSLFMINASQIFDENIPSQLKDYCLNNNADFALIPHIKFFKVGIGQWVFSSQVIVRLKLYDAQANLIAESTYDTFKKGGRILGSAENSIAKGTENALEILFNELNQYVLK